MDESKIIDPDEFERMFEFESSPSSAEPAHRAVRSSALFSTHGHVLILVARSNGLSVPEIAAQVRLSEGSVAGVLTDLIAAQMINQVDVGSNARFELACDRPGAAMSALRTRPRSAAALNKLYGRSA